MQFPEPRWAKYPKLTTRHWSRPGALRQKQLIKLLDNKKYRETLGNDFVEGLEKQRDLWDERTLKFFAWQAPVTLFLGMALVGRNSSGSIFGISIASAEQLREVLLIVSTLLALSATACNYMLADVREMLSAILTKQAMGDMHLREFLSVRFGVRPLRPIPYDTTLISGRFQRVLALFNSIATALFISMAIFIVLMVHYLNLVEAYEHPNFSHWFSLFVIAFVCLGDFATAVTWYIKNGVQPYRSVDYLLRLGALKKSDSAAYKSVMRQIGEAHFSRGLFGRVFGKPKLPELPELTGKHIAAYEAKRQQLENSIREDLGASGWLVD